MSEITRAATSRMASTRRSIGGEPRLRLDVDLTGLPADMEARWVRESVLGDRDVGNIQVRMMEGWQVATTEMFPNANPPLFPGDEDKSGGIVRRFGQVLMIRRRDECDDERARLREEDEDNKNAAIRLSGTKTESSEFDGKNFVEDKANKIVERTSAGTSERPAGKSKRFADA